jgi:hypothetical protein
VGRLLSDDRRADGPPRLRELAELAGEQWGVVSEAQLLAHGLSRQTIDRWLATGRIHRLHRGVFAVGHRSLAFEGRALAAVLACGPGAALSHLSGARHWGLLASDGTTATDVSAARSRENSPGIRIHRPRRLGEQDVTEHRGIPITSVARTCLDVAPLLGRSRFESMLAQAEVLRLYDLRALEDVVDRANGHRGRGRLARAIGREPALTRSQLERRFLTLARRAGLPAPIVNEAFDVVDHPGIRPDFYWPRERVMVETDGRATHLTRAAFQADRRRDAALAADGYVVVRFTYADVRDEPATVVARLRAVLEQRGGPSSRR